MASETNISNISVPDHFIVQIHNRSALGDLFAFPKKTEDYFSPKQQLLRGNLITAYMTKLIARKGNRQEGVSDDDIDISSEKVVSKEPSIFNTHAVEGGIWTMLSTAIAMLAIGVSGVPAAAVVGIFAGAALLGGVIGGMYGQKKEREEYNELAQQYILSRQQPYRQYTHTPTTQKSFAAQIEQERDRTTPSPRTF